MSAFFIDRPVFAWVIALLIMLGGAVATLNLPIEAYPEIAPPTVNISVRYPGASAEVIESSVTSVIEQQLVGLEGLLYFNASSSSAGSAQISLAFENGTDIEIAAVQTQNRVARAEPRLPQEVRDQGVVVQKANAGFLMVVALRSQDGATGEAELNNIVASRLLDQIQRIEGVGSATQFGAEYSMRIWLDADKLLGYGMSATEALAAVRAQNVQFASGSFGASPTADGQAVTANVSGESRLVTPEQFGEILLRANPDGTAVRLRDVARVELGAQSYSRTSRLDDQPVAAFGIQLLPGANALDVAGAVQERLRELETSFPPGVDWLVPFDSSTFVRSSIIEVVKTLFEAIVLVFLVILLFLQNLRATLIPTLVVPVALLGAFAGMYVFGFSINVLSMFGLVLAIGIVVDDAIIVIENVERLMREEHLPPKEATRKAMRQISGAIVAVTVVLCAVFIPAALMAGSVGAIYRQFSLTIAVSMLLSAIMALVFTPALCASMLRPEHDNPNRFFRWFNRGFDWLGSRYQATVGGAVRRTPRWMAGFAAVLVLCGLLFWRLPSSFLPEEDQGRMLAIVQLPPGATIDRTMRVMTQVGEILHRNEAVVSVLQVGGFSFLGQGENVGMAFVTLKDWDERPDAEQHATGVIRWANRELQQIREAQIFVNNLPTIRGLGQFGGFDFRLQDRAGLGYAALQDARATLLAEAAKNTAELAGVRTNALEPAPQVRLRVDRVQAESMGLSVNEVYQAVQLMLAPVNVNDFNYQGRVLRVQMQADAAFRMSPDDLGRYYVRSTGSGGMVPLSSVVEAEWGQGPPTLERYNGFASVPITGTPAAGESSGTAMAAMQRIVDEKLPDGIGFQWSGQSLQEILSGRQAPMLFALSIIVVFLCLAALYESWTVPIAVLLVVPLGLLGTLALTSLRGLPNDIFFKVGLITIIGLSAKNAILIIEFAETARLQGRSAIEATLEACRLRLRPILMTSIAFMLGVLPLAVSTGAGANSRHAIGTGVIGGMLGATVLGLLLIPVFYVVVRGVVDRISRTKDAADTATPQH